MPYYIYKQDGSIVAKCSSEPNETDLASRSENYLFTENDHDILSNQVVDGEIQEIEQVESNEYSSDILISWALSQVFVADLIPHMAAFLDFANKATETSKANFLAYAQAVSLTDTANTIVAKAIELGANIS